jgi:hypothetical protein
MLPSSLSRIFQLNVTTICSDDTASKSAYPEDIEGLRWKSSDDFRRYQMALKSGTRVGDSIVRRFSLFSKKFSIVEQKISVAIKEHEGTWSGK